MRTEFSVFTKPWKAPLPELAALVKRLGFDGVELPVRPGFQVTPESIAKGLPNAVRILSDNGLRIYSIASNADETTFAACAASGVPLVRVMAPIPQGNYLAAEDAIKRQYDLLVPSLEKHGVKLGVQNHCGRFVCNACGMRSLVSHFDPARIGIVWDAAHNALSGEEPDFALDIVWSHLAMVNLKNAVWKRTHANGAPGEWAAHWVTGREGLASWSRVASELRNRDYSGVVCLTAEYSDAESVQRFVTEDIAFAGSLFGS